MVTLVTVPLGSCCGYRMEHRLFPSRYFIWAIPALISDGHWLHCVLHGLEDFLVSEELVPRIKFVIFQEMSERLLRVFLYQFLHYRCWTCSSTFTCTLLAGSFSVCSWGIGRILHQEFLIVDDGSSAQASAARLVVTSLACLDPPWQVAARVLTWMLALMFNDSLFHRVDEASDI